MNATAAPIEPPPLDAHDSDPVLLGWMQGSPPPPDKQVRFDDGGMYTFPKLRWAYSNIRRLVPTTNVRRGGGPVCVLPRADRDDIDALTFMPIGGSVPMTWAQSLAANYTDGIVVLHRGRIVHERYFGALDAQRQHIAWSVTKSFFGTIAASLIAEGSLDARAPVSHYVPELAASGLGNAYAGGAAVAEDASTVWANPAGMSRFTTIQVAASVSGVFPSSKFQNDGSLPAFGQSLGGDGGNGGESAALPAMYIVAPITRDWAFGLGIGVPFGLETRWDDGWLGRYQALQSKIETLNVNPSISWRINDQFTLGAGVNWQRIKATFTNNGNYSAALANAFSISAAALPTAMTSTAAADRSATGRSESRRA